MFLCHACKMNIFLNVCISDTWELGKVPKSLAVEDRLVPVYLSPGLLVTFTAVLLSRVAAYASLLHTCCSSGACLSFF